MVWADFHDGDFLVIAMVLSLLRCAGLVLSNLSVATSWDLRWLKSHELGLFHVQVAETTVFVTQGLVLSVRVPVIVGLVVSVILVEGVVEVAINPGELGHMTEVESHLGVFSRLVVVSGSDWVDLLHEIGVDNGVSEVVVWFALVPEVLWGI
jgi:hypothetical protein